MLSAYLDSDLPVAVSDYTRQLIISSADEIDARHGTTFAARCRQRVAISYPAINTADFLDLDPGRDRPGAGRPRAGARAATCCSCPGWPTPRASTT